MSDRYSNDAADPDRVPDNTSTGGDATHGDTARPDQTHDAQASGRDYGQQHPHQAHGQPDAAQGYGQPDPAQGYGQPDANQGYGPPDADQGYSSGYGQADGAQSYGGQGSGAPYPSQGYDSHGYGTPYPAQGYENQGYASQYPSQGYDNQGYGTPYPTQGYDNQAYPNQYQAQGQAGYPASYGYPNQYQSQQPQQASTLGKIALGLVAVCTVLFAIGSYLLGQFFGQVVLLDPSIVQGGQPDMNNPQIIALANQVSPWFTAMGFASVAGSVGWVLGIIAFAQRRGRSFGLWAIILGIAAPIIGLILMVIAMLPAVQAIS